MENETSKTTRSKITSHQERAVREDEWIKEFLSCAGSATIGTTQGEQPFLSTLLFAYDEKMHGIYFHTARRGRVWDNIQSNPKVCLTAAEMGRLLPADTALNFSVEYQSVVVFGTARLIDDPAEAELGLQLILNKYFSHLHPGVDYRGITEGEVNATAVYWLEIEEWSGKRKAVPDDFPGSFHWGEKPSTEGS